MSNNLEYANFGSRLKASLIDAGLLILFANLLLLIMGYRSGLLTKIIVLMVLALFTSSKYQGTPGKMLLGLKVVDSHGNRLSLWRSILRYSIYFLFNIVVFFIYMEARIIFPYPEFIYYAGLAIIAALPILGYLMILFTERNQSLHDKIAGTFVIKKVTSGHQDDGSYQSNT